MGRNRVYKTAAERREAKRLAKERSRRKQGVKPRLPARADTKAASMRVLRFARETDHAPEKLDSLPMLPKLQAAAFKTRHLKRFCQFVKAAYRDHPEWVLSRKTRIATCAHKHRQLLLRGSAASRLQK